MRIFTPRPSMLLSAHHQFPCERMMPYPANPKILSILIQTGYNIRISKPLGTPPNYMLHFQEMEAEESNRLSRHT